MLTIKMGEITPRIIPLSEEQNQVRNNPEKFLVFFTFCGPIIHRGLPHAAGFASALYTPQIFIDK